MKINRVTFTGADDNTSLSEMMEIQRQYGSLVEWGILWGAKEGVERYPSEGWRDDAESFVSDLNLSAHLCGKYSRRIIEQSDYGFLNGYVGRYNRIQLNYHFREGYGITPVMLDAMTDCFGQLIFQWNENNSISLHHVVKSRFIQFLIDGSGGHGKPIDADAILYPPNCHYVGFAGGLSPENIGYVVSLINRNGIDKWCWIDMESGVRTDGKFDLDKVKEVLSIVTKYNSL